MQRLTPLGKLFIVLLILAGLYGGFRYLQNQGIIGKGEETAQTNASGGSYADSSSATPPSSQSSSTSQPSATEANTGGPAFSYTPPAPVNGKLKGVVEMGASGFNSFIVKIDDQKNWQLEKSEFGNSLVLENMATDDDIRAGLKKYIGNMLDFGVSGKDIHFVVSSGAVKAENTQKIIKALKQLNYYVNQVTPEQEGTLALKSVLPDEYRNRAFVVDIGSGNTKISWNEGGKITALETYGAKYFQDKVDDQKVYQEVSDKAKQVPNDKRQTCFIIGGVPFELAKAVRKDKERYTVLNAPDAYKLDNAKSKAGLNIYKAIADATGCQQFVFDWDANFTIGFLLGLP
jgi:phage gp16-like protein